jgi:hypothetical protein
MVTTSAIDSVTFALIGRCRLNCELYPREARSEYSKLALSRCTRLCRSLPFPDRFASCALQSPTHGSLGASKSAADRGIQRDILLLVNNAREISKDHFYSAHMIDAATGAIHIF